MEQAPASERGSGYARIEQAIATATLASQARGSKRLIALAASNGELTPAGVDTLWTARAARIAGFVVDGDTVLSFDESSKDEWTPTKCIEGLSETRLADHADLQLPVGDRDEWVVYEDND